ncbi:MAG: hypothetical protein QXF26_04605 [Candidatus Bathyarchaeia archaeon]
MIEKGRIVPFRVSGVKRKLVILLIAVVGVILAGILVVFYAVPQMRPSLLSPPGESIVMGMYVNQTDTYRFESYVNALFGALFQVRIEFFSGDLKLLTLGNETIPRIFPYSWQRDIGKDGYVVWGFRIIAPSQPGNYTVNLRFILSSWIFSQEYPQKITVKVELPKPPPPPEEPLLITLDKNVYTRGEYMTITIKNRSNETLWFTNAAYNLCVEKFNGTDWVFYKEIVGDSVMTPLEPGETGQVTVKLDVSPGTPFPAGRYRVGTKGIYVEFTVVRPMT